jgi:hypothetical protein
MNESLQQYINDARDKGHSDERIQADLTGAGWDAGMVKSGLSGHEDLAVPPPPPGGGSMSGRSESRDNFVKIVPYRSTAGLEYLILFISLWISASSLAAILHASIDGLTGSDSSIYQGGMSFAAAALIVGLPIFGFLFLRLKKAELADPDIRRDLNRKNAVQLTLLVTFLLGIGNTIYYVYQLLNGGSADGSSGSAIGSFLHTLVTVGISGAIFVYYWIDDHKKIAAQ